MKILIIHTLIIVIYGVCYSQSSRYLPKTIIENDSIFEIHQINNKPILVNHFRDSVFLSLNRNEFVGEFCIWDYNDGFIYTIPIPPSEPYHIPYFYRATINNISNYYLKNKINQSYLIDSVEYFLPYGMDELEIPFKPLWKYKLNIRAREKIFPEFIITDSLFELIVFDNLGLTISYWRLNMPTTDLKLRNEVWTIKIVDYNGEKIIREYKILENYNIPEWNLVNKITFNKKIEHFRATRSKDNVIVLFIDDEIYELTSSGTLNKIDFAINFSNTSLVINKNTGVNYLINNEIKDNIIRTNNRNVYSIIETIKDNSIIQF